MARRWTRLAAILGLLFLAYGIGWLTIWNEGIRGDSSMEWLASELQPPFEARLIVLIGLMLLLAATLSWLIRRFAAKNPGKITKS
jgi:ribose/xylose/arabinose/galactoside ABC-type transport system permease subunit